MRWSEHLTREVDDDECVRCGMFCISCKCEDGPHEL